MRYWWKHCLWNLCTKHFASTALYVPAKSITINTNMSHSNTIYIKELYIIKYVRDSKKTKIIILKRYPQSQLDNKTMRTIMLQVFTKYLWHFHAKPNSCKHFYNKICIAFLEKLSQAQWNSPWETTDMRVHLSWRTTYSRQKAHFQCH